MEVLTDGQRVEEDLRCNRLDLQSQIYYGMFCNTDNYGEIQSLNYVL